MKGHQDCVLILYTIRYCLSCLQPRPNQSFVGDEACTQGSCLICNDVCLICVMDMCSAEYLKSWRNIETLVTAVHDRKEKKFL
jgi:hypothetical protein